MRFMIQRSQSLSSWNRVAIILSTLMCMGAAPAQIKPRLDQCTLELHDKAVHPIRTSSAGERTFFVGSREFVVKGDAITESEPKEGKPLWSIRTPDGHQLRWLAGDGSIAYLAGFTAGSGRDDSVPDAAPQIRRLDLAGQKWLAPLAIPADAKDVSHNDVVVAALADLDHLAVLTEQSRPGDRADERRKSGYRLSMFGTGHEKPEWSQQFPSAGERPEPGVYLMAASMPDYADSDVRFLSWLDGGILLCAGEKEDLICLNFSGKPRWRVPRVWEYQRGFIGPSVWSHYIARFGIEDWEQVLELDGRNTTYGNDAKPGTPEHQKRVDELRKPMLDARDDFNKRFQCAIVGGPVILPVTLAGPDRKPENHIFVAVARGPNAWNWGYLSDCIVYELLDDGQVIGTVNLPDMVSGSTTTTVDGSLIWSCKKGGILSFRSSTGRQFQGMGPGHPDLICNVDWCRHFHAAAPAAWLTADPASNACAFGKTQGFLTVGRGYVSRKTDRVYRFPISVVDLRNGTDRIATLNVPFVDDLPPPDSNFRGIGEQIDTIGPYLLGVTRLSLHDNKLDVTIGMEGSALGVSFDVGIFGE